MQRHVRRKIRLEKQPCFASLIQKNRCISGLGLEKDLFLPYKEQTKRVQPGEECLAALYIDKSSRLCATMKVYEYLKKDSPYQETIK